MMRGVDSWRFRLLLHQRRCVFWWELFPPCSCVNMCPRAAAVGAALSSTRLCSYTAVCVLDVSAKADNPWCSCVLPLWVSF